MSTNEATPLLGKLASDPGEHPLHGCAENEPPATQTGKRFAPWQIAVFFGIILARADTSLVWATHETVASHFDNLDNSSWMMTSFAIGCCVTFPLYGRLSDDYGRLRPLIAAYVLFCIGCTLCGIGQSYWQVILGRTLTGCGASGIVSLASIIITDIAEPLDVAVSRSYVNIASILGISIGGPFGGFLGETVGWRWSFLGQVPIATTCCIIIARGLQNFLLEADRSKNSQMEEPQDERRKRLPSFDYLGAVTLAIWITSFLVIIDLQVQLSWTHPLLLSLIIIGIISFLLFLILETYPGGRELLIPLSLFKTEVGAFCVGQLLLVGSCQGFVSQIVPYFINTRGSSDAEAGWLIVPVSIGNAVGSLVAGRMIKRYGSYKRLSLASLFLSIAISIVILVQWSYPMNALGSLTSFPFGLFAGMVTSAQFFGLYLCAPKQQMTTAIGIYYMSQQIGIAVGITIMSTLLNGQFENTLQNLLVDIPGFEKIIESILSDSSIVKELSEPVRSLVRRGYLSTFWVVPAIAIMAQAIAIWPLASTTEKYSDPVRKS